MSKSPLQKPIEIKISTVVAVSAILHATDIAVLDVALKQMTGGSTDFFDDEFAVIDVAALAPQVTIDWARLIALLKSYHLNPVAVRNATPLMTAAILAHGLSLDGGGRTGEESPAPAPTPAPTSAPVVMATAPVRAPAVAAQAQAATAVISPGAMIIDTPVRAGQRIYARGCDLIITAVVNNGAEIIADGSIHIYSALYGRALAGASGNPDARIFALSMEPELVSIAGVYRTFDDGFPQELARQPAQIRLVGDRIDILAVSPASRP
jgi:septum site-determining protein MinC